MITLGRLLLDARAILNDTVATSGSLRFSDEDLIQAFNHALLQARGKRPDAFLAMGLRGAVPQYTAGDIETPFPLDQIFYSPFLYYIVGHSELREDTFTDDGRATALLNKFVTGLLQVMS
jgi:hypothetical protein